MDPTIRRPWQKVLGICIHTWHTDISNVSFIFYHSTNPCHITDAIKKALLNRSAISQAHSIT